MTAEKYAIGDTEAQPAHTDAAAETLQSDLLQGVSRTFALTIPQLPQPLARAVSNAYLLCRIADTIEDEPALSSEQKAYFCDQFLNVVAGNVSAQLFAAELHPLLSQTTLASERELVYHTARVIGITRSLNEIQRHAIENCIRTMARGMAEFQINASPHGLRELAQLDRYCYYVAGVVGEMLTRLFCDHAADIARHREDMMLLAVSFGQGLQMTNILKDVWDDRERGACWLPQQTFIGHGFDLQHLTPGCGDAGFIDGLGDLIGVTHGHLKNALAYTLLIPSRHAGIRRFCLWAIGMAVLTLRKLNKRRDFSSGDEVKISRSSVKATVLLTALLGHSDAMLKLLFMSAGAGLPLTPVKVTRLG
ncbi:MAG: phytoene/squalene synthase family protein [Burkholderiales bacterium]